MGEKQKARKFEEQDIVGVMEPGIPYFTSDIADLLGTRAMFIVPVIRQMKINGMFDLSWIKGKAAYSLRANREPAGPRYQAPMKPLTGYDPFALQRLCEGARKAETGMA
ncbi:hypothetical protein [Herbaspirillum robiniae]|uniref:hypothetical protein n=1 Tax=Herbaspirillum robiniae TaxID=2014887 RepID=UPI0009A15645|nr:hypothetical protein [Herbaspirillum robiniae]